MWFYDDEGYITACGPVNKVSDEEGKFHNVVSGVPTILEQEFQDPHWDFVGY